jgi:hypothetical protein
MKRNVRLVAAALIVAGGLGCGDATSSPPADQPGTVVVSMTSSHAADGAVFVTVRGPGLSSAATANAAYTVFSRLVGPNELNVIVVGGSVAPGELVTVPIAASNRLSAYSVQIEQVADQADSLRLDLSGYKTSLAAQRN